MKLFKLTKSLVLRLFSTCLPTQMMAAGNPNWWSMQQTSSDVQQPFLHLLNNQFSLHGGSSSSSSSSSSSTSSSSLPFSPLIADQSVPQDLPQSWSQLLLNGMGSNNEEERMGPSNHFHQIHHVISPSSPPPPSPLSSNHLHESIFAINHQQQQQQQQQQQNLIKQETSLFDPRSGLYGHGNNIYSQQRPVSWSQISPKSSITTLSNNNDNNNNNNNFMNFSTNCYKGREKNHLVEQSSECKSPSIATGVAKKPRVQAASTPPLKVRKEKLGDRITALHQIVSPFGKTDTASVLLEAIGYIRFLQGQVEALCSPYLGSVSGINQHSAHGERNGLFPDHPGQDGCAKDLRSRGLCLVPTSCTQLVANDQNTTDYWAPSLGPPGF